MILIYHAGEQDAAVSLSPRQQSAPGVRVLSALLNSALDIVDFSLVFPLVMSGVLRLPSRSPRPRMFSCCPPWSSPHTRSASASLALPAAPRANHLSSCSPALAALISLSLEQDTWAPVTEEENSPKCALISLKSQREKIQWQLQTCRSFCCKWLWYKTHSRSQKHNLHSHWQDVHACKSICEFM